MRPLIFVTLILFIKSQTYSQSFLDSYKKFRLDKIASVSDHKKRKEREKFIKSQILEIDTVFQSYKTKRNFDFNTADTLYLIYETPAESPFTSEIIIWSGKDTISYKQGFQMTDSIEPFKYKRIITYGAFIPKLDNPKGFKIARRSWYVG